MIAKLLILSACLLPACSSPEITRVVFVDGCEPTELVQPVDLTVLARAQHASTGWRARDWFEVTVEAVASARELVVRDQFGVERLRPTLSAATLEDMASADPEAVRVALEKRLIGEHLLEPHDLQAPVVAEDGVRCTYLFTEELQPLDDVVRAEVRRLPADGEQESSRGAADLSRVKRSPSELLDRVRAAVAMAEEHSSIRVPWNLSVEWALPNELPPIGATLYAPWWHDVGRWFDADETPVEAYRTELSLSLPGGRIFLRPDHDWREFELQVELLRALARQHQFALCAAGHLTMLDDEGMLLMEGHASSLAHEILRRAGFSADSIALAREWDQFSPATQVFDRYRARKAQSPDDALMALAAAKNDAHELVDEVYVGQFESDRDDDGPLVFERTGVEAGRWVVTITNASDRPFSGYANGFWKHESKEGKDLGGYSDVQFALRLPPRGHVSILTGGAEGRTDVGSVWLPYSAAPAPIAGADSTPRLQ